MSTKIQINSFEALERLIGNDNELEIEVRNSIIQKFAEKHLKPLANSGAISDALKQIQETINKEVSDQISKDIATFKFGWCGKIEEVKLRSEIKTAIDQQVRAMVDEKIRTAVTEAVKFWATDNMVVDRVDRAIAYYNEQTIKEEVKKRFAQMMK